MSLDWFIVANFCWSGPCPVLEDSAPIQINDWFMLGITMNTYSMITGKNLYFEVLYSYNIYHTRVIVLHIVVQQK